MLGKAQLIIVIITILLMIACLLMLIWSFKQLRKNKTWPPVVQTCPDYWKIDASGNCLANEGNTGKCSYSASAYTFGTDTCEMYKWTQGSTGITGIYTGQTPLTIGCTGVRWDGISYGYGVNNPCYVDSE